MMLASLQRIATMMDAEGLEAAPVLVTGSVEASAQEVRDRSDPSTPAQDDPGTVSTATTLHSDNAPANPRK
jgi:hypothetical protein